MTNPWDKKEFKDFDDFTQTVEELFEVAGCNTHTVIKDEESGLFGMVVTDGDVELDQETIDKCVQIKRANGITLIDIEGDENG